LLSLTPLVRHDIDIGKYNTTQELFLSKVGIANSYSEDNKTLVDPFFVSFSDRDTNVQEKSGVHFTYVKRNQMFFVFTTKKKDFIPSYV